MLKVLRQVLWEVLFESRFERHSVPWAGTRWRLSFVDPSVFGVGERGHARPIRIAEFVRWERRLPVGLHPIEAG